MIRTQARRRRLLATVTAVALTGLLVSWVADRGDGKSSETDEPRAGTWTVTPHSGVGAWVDVYDWTEEFTDGQPTVGLTDVDRMAELGIDTLYLQTAHNRSAAAGVIERDRLMALIDRAHERGLFVVAWYLPPLVDLDADVHRALSSAELPVDGLGIDIESVEVADGAERNRRLLGLTAEVRERLGDGKTLAAITPSPVHLQVVNPAFWPDFPWVEVADAYDVLLPMSYWSIREEGLRDGEGYVAEDIDRLRMSTGQPDIPIHVIGGIADALPADQVTGMVRAIEERGALGGSLYDWDTSNPDQWAALAPLHN